MPCWLRSLLYLILFQFPLYISQRVFKIGNTRSPNKSDLGGTLLQVCDRFYSAKMAVNSISHSTCSYNVTSRLLPLRGGRGLMFLPLEPRHIFVTALTIAYGKSDTLWFPRQDQKSPCTFAVLFRTLTLSASTILLGSPNSPQRPYGEANGRGSSWQPNWGLH